MANTRSRLVPTLILAALEALLPIASAAGAIEFCLEGELDLGTRYQGTRPHSGEWYRTSWCVVTEDDSSRVFFTGSGRSNPDMDGQWSVAYLPPDTVRIVNRASPPDIEFQGTDNLDEALRVRRLDPRRLVNEFRHSPDAFDELQVEIDNDRLISVKTNAVLPLRGDVDVVWNWDWSDEYQPSAKLVVEGEVLFRATGRWRNLADDEAAKLWEATPGPDTVEVPGENWPARVNMRLESLADDVYLVTGVRTGFQHMVINTNEGLVIADAPAGWVEFHHIPPSDLVPGLGASGLAEQFVDFLKQEFPGRPVRAVALTHFHDDHAGGARAFAAAGATIYTTKESGTFFARALNRSNMPTDRLTETSASAKVSPVEDSVTIGQQPKRAKIVSMGANPHSYAMLGVWAIDRDFFFVSDVHVPNSDAESPRAERALTECWFANWAVLNLPPGVQVVNSHSASITPVSRLAKYLESDPCRH